MLKRVVLWTLASLVVIQFIPYGRNHTNPKVESEPHWVTPQVRSLFMRACGDCHSNETKWPWYSNVAPLSWVIYNHVQEGREHFNVSLWGIQKKNKADEAAEEIQEGDMPILGYLVAHPEARLTDAEKETLIRALKQMFPDEKED